MGGLVTEAMTEDGRFEKGEPVCLSQHGLDCLGSRQRYGKVASTPNQDRFVRVLWDGTKVPQSYAVRFIQSANAEKPQATNEG